MRSSGERRMRAIVVSEPGPPEVLQSRDVPIPEPGPGEVRVRVSAFGLNRADLLQRRGMYPAPPGVPPDIPGLEYAGTIDAMAEDIRGHTLGDRVMGIVGGGAYAEYVVTPAAHVLPVPEEISFEAAAAIPEAFLTGHDALEQLVVTAGEWVLVHAVASGVGTATLQLVHARGAQCVGTSRTREKLERAAELGLDAGIDTTGTEELTAAVRRVTGHGANAVVDLIGGRHFNATLDCLAPRGRLILVGLTAGARAELDLGLILRNRLRIVGTLLRSRSTEEKTALTRSFAEKVLPFFAEGRLRPVLDRVFLFDEVPAAHEYLETNASFGKIVVRLPQSEENSS